MLEQHLSKSNLDAFLQLYHHSLQERRHSCVSIQPSIHHSSSNMPLTAALLALASTTSASLLWDGRANEYSSSAFLSTWSWSNQVGPYQYYIHGPSPVTSYVNMSPSYANPADASSEQGFQITIDSTSYWNGQNMRRTELIPQTAAGINKGKVFYHFSMQFDGEVNPPDPGYEHQVCFFESHFTEMKFGLISGEQGTENGDLQWFVGGKRVWSEAWEAGELRAFVLILFDSC